MLFLMLISMRRPNLAILFAPIPKKAKALIGYCNPINLLTAITKYTNLKKLLLYTLLPVVLAAFSQCEKTSTANTTTTGSGGSTARFAIQGNYLYTVDNENLRVYNITDIANPVLKNTVSVGFQIET